MHATENGLVLDWCRDDRVATLLTTYAPCAQDREVVGFGAPRRKRDLVGSGADTVGEPLASLVQCRPSLASPPVQAGGIAEARAVERRHGFEHLRPHGRGRRVVEIDGLGHRINIPGL